MINGKKTTAAFILFILAFIPLANAMAPKEDFPFDPAKIPMDENWEKVLLNKGGFKPRWCGPRQLFFLTALNGGRLIDVFTKKIKDLSFTKGSTFVGCMPSGKYMFFSGKPRKDYHKGLDSIVFYNTETNEPVKTLPYIPPGKFSHIQRLRHSLLSPDGRYMAWFGAGEIELEGEEKITLLPVLAELNPNLLGDLAWSPGNSKIFLFHISDELERRDKLTVYDRETASYRTFSLDLGVQGVMRIKVSLDGKSLYFRATQGEINTGNLYKFNLDELGSASTKITPEFLTNAAERFNPGPNGTIVFNTVASPDWTSYFPFDFSGIFLADADGNVTGRLTVGYYDRSPKFSINGNMIVFERIDPKILGNWEEFIYILKRKNR